MSKDLTNDLATTEWLNSQKKSTRVAYKSSWLHFLEFAKLSGDQILADRKTDKDFRWEKQVLAVKTWLVETKGQAENTAKAVTTAARSFFAFHRVGLEFRKPEKARLKEAHAKSEDYRFSVADLQKMFNVANLTEKYVLTVGKSFGLRAGDFMKLVRGDLEAYIDREPPISIGAINTQKEGVRAYPFVDVDAQPIIKLMLEKMTREGRTKPSERMLTYTHKMQLSRVIKRLVQKAGLNVGNKNVKFHCLRKFLIDHLSSYMSESKWKQLVGKSISEAAYVSPEGLRQDYARATPETCFTQPTQLIELQKRQEAIEEIVSGLTLEQKEKMERHGLSLRSLRLSRKQKKPETRHNGGQVDCDFDQIEETQLLGYLKAGWSVVHKLSDGQLVVKR
jgi:hypothetical protein